MTVSMMVELVAAEIRFVLVTNQIFADLEIQKVPFLVNTLIRVTTLSPSHNASPNTFGISSPSAQKGATVPYRCRQIKVTFPQKFSQHVSRGSLSKHSSPLKILPQSVIQDVDFRTGRQRKPLEVIGVYDPIPRYPTTPNGKVLEDQDKV